MSSHRFIATHVIQTGMRRIYVHAEPGDEHGLILYTEAEWDGAENADWTYDAEEGLQFQGSTSAPICDGASLERFGSCQWTANDGWNPGGTKQAGTTIRVLDRTSGTIHDLDANTLCEIAAKSDSDSDCQYGLAVDGATTLAEWQRTDPTRRAFVLSDDVDDDGRPIWWNSELVLSEPVLSMDEAARVLGHRSR